MWSTDSPVKGNYYYLGSAMIEKIRMSRTWTKKGWTVDETLPYGIYLSLSFRCNNLAERDNALD